MEGKGALPKTITKWTLITIGITVVIYLFFQMGNGIYTLVRDCWACDVLGSVYDAISKTSYLTFFILQDNAITLLSVCLALWIVFETYKILIKGVSPNPEVTIDHKYITNIYKKIILATAVIGLFLIQSPRNIFANTYEIVFDFGTGVGREILQRNMKRYNITPPPECQNTNPTLVYKEGMVLSENTRDNMICMIKEIDATRKIYMEIGLQLFEYGAVPIIITLVTNVAIRIGTLIGGRSLMKFGTDKWLGKIQKQISKNKKNSKKLSEKLQEVLDDINSGGKKTAKRQQLGQNIKDYGGTIANMSTITAIILNDSIRMGLTGITLVLGLFFINILFAFIFIEKMLFLGASLIIFPILAVCYVFDETKSYTTTALKSLFDFSIGLIFLCIGMVICVEVNNWILGGMFSANPTENITQTKYALELLMVGDIEAFNETISSQLYFLYAIFAIFLNYKIIMESQTFAGWFMGAAPKNALGDSIFNFSKSVVSWSQSAKRELFQNSKSDQDTTVFDRMASMKNRTTDRVKKLFGKGKDV